MTINEMLEALARTGLGAQPNDEQALSVMLLLHTYHFQLGGPVLSDRPGIKEVSAIAQRHAAEVIAAVWPDRRDEARTSAQHWYYQFNARTPFEVADDIEPPWDERLARVKEVVLQSGLVQTLNPED